MLEEPGKLSPLDVADYLGNRYADRLLEAIPSSLRTGIEFAQLASMRDTGALTEEEYTVAVHKVAEGSCAGAYDATSIPVVQTGVVVGVVPPAIRRVTPLRSNIYSGFSSDV